jgi:hypothetical protein
MHMADEEEKWQQDIQYYFNENGSIAKRYRQLFSAGANVELDETTYYEDGRVIKEITHHHPMIKGAKATEDFSDPEAPQYLSVDDLPFPDIPDLWERLA